MSVETIFFLILGGAAGGFINGLAGTGTALFSLGFFLVVLEPAGAVAVVASLALISGLRGVWEVRASIRQTQRRLLRFLIPGLIGLPLGLWLLQLVEAQAIRFAIAGLLILYGGFFGLRSELPRFERPTPRIDMGIGLVGGVLGGLAALSGALPTIWFSMRPWPRAETRAVLQPYNVTLLGLTTLGLALQGAFTVQVLLALAIALPTGLIAAQGGLMLYRRLSDTAFRRLLILLCLVLGVGILIGDLT